MLLQTYEALLLLLLLSVVAASLDNQVNSKDSTARSSPLNKGRGRQLAKRQRYPTKNPQRRAQGSQQGRPQKSPSRSPNKNNNNFGAINSWRNPQKDYGQSFQGLGSDRFPYGTVQQQIPNTAYNLGTTFPWISPYDPQYSQGQQSDQLVPDRFRQQIPNSGNNQVVGRPGNVRNSPVYIIYYPYPVSSPFYQDVGINQRFPYTSSAFMCTPSNQFYKIRLRADLTKLKSSFPNISVRMIKSSKSGFPGGYMTPFDARQLCQSYFPTNGEAEFAQPYSPTNANGPWGIPQIAGPMGNTNPGPPNLFALNSVPPTYNQGYDYNGDEPDNFSDEDYPQLAEDERYIPYNRNRGAVSQPKTNATDSVIKDQQLLEPE